jgi:hypothetical protein
VICSGIKYSKCGIAVIWDFTMKVLDVHLLGFARCQYMYFFSARSGASGSRSQILWVQEKFGFSMPHPFTTSHMSAAGP